MVAVVGLGVMKVDHQSKEILFLLRIPAALILSLKPASSPCFTRLGRLFKQIDQQINADCGGGASYNGVLPVQSLRFTAAIATFRVSITECVC